MPLTAPHRKRQNPLLCLLNRYGNRDMRFAGAVIFLLWTVVTAAGTELPEVVARCGEKTIRREEVMPLLRQASPEDTARLPRRELLKKVLTEHFCSEALLKMLTDAGFPPDAENTLGMIRSTVRSVRIRLSPFGKEESLRMASMPTWTDCVPL